MIYKNQSILYVCIISIFLILLVLASCIRDKSPLSLSEDKKLPEIPSYKIEPTFNCDYWSIPKEETFHLFFQLYTTIRVDSLIAGATQYRLDQARTVDTKLINIHPGPDWQLGILLVGVSEELYHSFNPNTHRFSNLPLDYLLDEFDAIKGVKGINRNYVKLHFNNDYNISVIGNIFEAVEGIRYADTNSYGSFPESSHSGVILEIEDELFNFNFYESIWTANNTHNWEIHVINDKVTLIGEWDEKIY